MQNNLYWLRCWAVELGYVALLSDLLDWDPVGRAGDSNIRKAPYWGDADWELLDMGRFPSPMMTLEVFLGEESTQADSGPKLKKQATKRVLAKPESDAGRLTATLAKDTRAAEQAASGRSNTFGLSAEAIEEKEMLMNVTGWDFVSPHALADEYVRAAGAAFSFV